MDYDKDDPRSHPDYFRDVSLEEIHDHLTTVEVDRIIDPGDAMNERGNPEVEVKVHEFGKVFERYRVEFVLKTSKKGDYTYYRYGPCTSTVGAELVRHENEATYKAAKAFAEYTDTSVAPMIHPKSELKDREGRYTEE